MTQGPSGQSRRYLHSEVEARLESRSSRLNLPDIVKSERAGTTDAKGGSISSLKRDGASMLCEKRLDL